MSKPGGKPKPPPTAEQQAAAHAEAEQDILTPEEYQALRAEQIWSYDEMPQDLSLEHRLFVRSYIIDRNPVAALCRLNHQGTPQQLKRKAEGYLANTEVRDAIEYLGARMMAKLEITAEKINERLAAVAFFDPREVMEFDAAGVRLLHSKYWRRDHAWAMQSIEMGQQGIKLKMYDGIRAAEILGKNIGSIKDDNAEAAAAAAKASAEAVMDKLLDIFDKTHGISGPSATVLPPPETRQ